VVGGSEAPGNAPSLCICRCLSTFGFVVICLIEASKLAGGSKGARRGVPFYELPVSSNTSF
jgi:hypothetical protein